MDYSDKIIDLCKMLDSKKAEDIVVCYNNGRNVVDYFIVATMTSCAHIKGVADYVLEECAKLPLVYGDIKVEGFSTSNWLVLDIDNVFVHLFTKEERLHYNFDKFINDGGNVISFNKMLQNIEQNKQKQKNKEAHEEKARLKQKEKEKQRAQKKNGKIIIKAVEKSANKQKEGKK